jgi:hypothetical protein
MTLDGHWTAVSWDELPNVETSAGASWLAFRFRLLDGEGVDGIWCQVSMNRPMLRPDTLITSLRQNASHTYSRQAPFKALAAVRQKAMQILGISHMRRRFRVDCARYTFYHMGRQYSFQALIPVLQALLMVSQLP